MLGSSPDFGLSLVAAVSTLFPPLHWEFGGIKAECPPSVVLPIKLRQEIKEIHPTKY